VKAVMIRRRT